LEEEKVLLVCEEGKEDKAEGKRMFK